VSEDTTAAELAAALQDPGYRRAWEQATELMAKAARYDAVLARARRAEAELERFVDLFERWDAADQARRAEQWESLERVVEILELLRADTGT
jgi:hypothetical protein